ncbi:hypothetical protein [Mesorhizobium sp. L-2-11]|uniref:hypothetical protein n=1 Tax=Mesorhizobium sp. L-2-11 TaxID=2744521 RepID=UPI001FD052A0|nr:hypothetical protein [Mesorhizobium sp. L-2-11]
MKVIQVPSPTAGSISPEEGTVRIAGAGGAPGAAAGNISVALEAAAALTNVLRVMIIVCHPCPLDLLYSRPPAMVPADRFSQGRSAAVVSGDGSDIDVCLKQERMLQGLGCASQTD